MFQLFLLTASGQTGPSGQNVPETVNGASRVDTDTVTILHRLMEGSSVRVV